MRPLPKPPRIIAHDGSLVPVHLRVAMNGTHGQVFDILRDEPRGALCGCLRCGATWDEGGIPPATCDPWAAR